MRRYQVMIATEFPTELNGMFKNVETKGNPWGMNASGRNDWIAEVDFDVRVFGMDGEDAIPDDVDYLFWVGCAGAFEDRAKRTTKAVAELLHIAGVAVHGAGRGRDLHGRPRPSRGQRVPLPDAGHAERRGAQRDQGDEDRRHLPALPQHPQARVPAARRQLRGRAPHRSCSTTWSRRAASRPVAPGRQQTVTYHDPCYLGRHNDVYLPPRDLIEATGATKVEMERHGDKSFCCGAGGARMWMEEKIGTQVNQNRGDEAIATGASTVAVACPFCSVMLNDAVTSRQGEGKAEGVEVVDVATLLLAPSKS